jgi:low affinity Fe/Cu permease
MRNRQRTEAFAQRAARSGAPLVRPQVDVPVREAPTATGRFRVLFGQLSSRVSALVGSPTAFILAVLALLVWAAAGPLFGFSDTWQLLINTATTIVTFLIVFLIQHTQNKDARAIQLKLNEVLAAIEGASNRLINVEKLSDEELDRLQDEFGRLAERVRAQGDARRAHSVEEEEPPRGRPGELEPPTPASRPRPRSASG